MNFLCYDSKGQITRSMALPLLAGERVLRAADDASPAALAAMADTHMVTSAGAVVERPALAGFDKTEIIADGTDTATIEGLPAGARVTVDGAAYVSDDGTFALAVTVAGTYRVEVDAWPYRLLTVDIVATEVAP